MTLARAYRGYILDWDGVEVSIQWDGEQIDTASTQEVARSIVDGWMDAP